MPGPWVVGIRHFQLVGGAVAEVPIEGTVNVVVKADEAGRLMLSGRAPAEAGFVFLEYDAGDGHREGPYWANLVGAQDDNFAAVYKANIQIPSDGDYTFGVHSDDGFGLRISGAEFFQTTGNGFIDRGDTRTIYFPSGTGDSNTRGSTRL